MTAPLPFTRIVGALGGADPQFVRNFHLLDIPGNGLDIDLVAVTGRLYPNYQCDMLLQTDGPPQAPYNGCANREQPDCPKVDVGLQRCSRCRQVLYCSAKCQALDWPRHKTSCRRPFNLSIAHDGLVRAADRLADEKELMAMITAFAFAVLNMKSNRCANLQHSIVIYCKTFSDIANSSRRVLQISRISLEKRDDDPWERRTQLATGNDVFHAVFKLCTPNGEFTHSTLLTIKHNIVSLLCEKMFGDCPIFFLLLNHIIWEDTNDKYGLRIPA
ncbi:zinc finger MYND domain-containing protein [Phanerochaete sordida]|uniref:Zinc finger MYND domain-containing protein n=1 Tax=Phanerochaete sordida TaxID=48140 RepID=A0A9P3GRW1_9APHY|nr:zinc finger MYND domain-containing protein [Phanerochaete sordida]